MTKNTRNQRPKTRFTMTIHDNQPSSQQQHKKKQPTKTTFAVTIPKDMPRPANPVAKPSIKSALKATDNKDRERKSGTFSLDIET